MQIVLRPAMDLDKLITMLAEQKGPVGAVFGAVGLWYAFIRGRKDVRKDGAEQTVAETYKLLIQQLHTDMASLREDNQLLRNEVRQLRISNAQLSADVERLTRLLSSSSEP